MNRIGKTAIAALIVLSILAIAELCLDVFGVPEYILPGPIVIVSVFADQSLTVLKSWYVTTSEALVGLLAAMVLSSALAIVALFSPMLMARAINSFGIVVQSIPLLAIAPLLSLWFGHSFLAKAAAAMIVCFFPLLTGWLAGFRAVSIENRQLFDNMHANPFQRAWYLMIPSALPYLFGGLRVAMPLALLGAIVAEFIGSSEGLGFQILNNSYYLRTPAMFAYLTVAAVTGWLFTFVSGQIEKKALFWHGEIRQH